MIKHLMLVAGVVACGTEAFAQNVEEPLDVPGKVANAFRPTGISINTFTLYPEFSLEAEGTDNVLARDDTEIGDYVLDAQAGFRLIRRAPDSRIAVSGFAGHDFHFNLPSEDRTRFGGRFFYRNGAPKRTRWEVTATARRDSIDREDNNDVVAARKPVQFSRFSGDIDYYRKVNKLIVGGGVGIVRTNYSDAMTRTGGIIDQDFRNLSLYRTRAEVAYEFKPGIEALGRASYERLDYDFGPGDPAFVLGSDRNRDSDRYRAEGGIRFELNNKLYGEALVGYLRRDFAFQFNPLNNLAGLSFHADLLYLPSPNYSLRISADREFEESASRDIAGFRSTGGSLQLDHSPATDVVLTAKASYRHVEPIGPGDDRDEYSFELRATRHINRRYRMAVSARYSGRDSRTPFISYEGGYLGVALFTRF